MQDIRETADNQQPHPYILGKLYHAAGLEYNPFQPDTAEFTDFCRGKLDAWEEYELAADISSWDQPDQ